VLTRSPARPAWINYPQLTARAETISEVVGTARQGVRPHLVDPIVPAEDSLVLTKVRHSAFYATSVAYLLRRLETKRLVLVGQVTEQCILYTALDAYVRHIPSSSRQILSPESTLISQRPP
jgi:nicotinamidase-related amidase